MRTALFAVLVASSAFACHAKTSHDPGLGDRLVAIVKPKPVVLPAQRLARLAGDPGRSAPLILARASDHAVALVMDADDAAVNELDLETGALLSSTKLSSAPREAVVLGDGTLAVVLPEENAVVVLERHVDGARYREVRRMPAPDDPRALALSPDDTTLYLSTGASHTLVAVDALTSRERARVDLPREPRGIAVSADGASIYVSHATFNATSLVERDAFLAGKAIPVRVAHGPSRCAAGSAQGIGVPVGVPSGSAAALEGDCADEVARHAHVLVSAMADGKETVFSPLVMARPTPRPSFIRSKFGRRIIPMKPPPGMFGSAFDPLEEDPFLSGVDSGGGMTGYGTSAGSGPPERFEARAIVVGEQVSTVRSAPPPSESKDCLLPVSAALSVRMGEVYVACAGTKRVHTMSMSAAPRRKHALVVPDSPSAVAMAPGGRKLVVWSSIGRTLSLHLVDAPEKPRAHDEMPVHSMIYMASVPRSVERDQAWLDGRSLFTATFDARISRDGRGCASCHVDGADDAIVWSTPEGKRRTRTLEGQLGTGPYGWRGEHKTLDEHIRVTEKQLGGTGLPDAEREKLVVYVRTLGARKRAAGPAIVDELAKRGRELFVSTKHDCATCHTGGGAESDRAVHDVGSGGAFLTPTLAGVATRPQLFHDGKYKTLDELLVSSKTMGRAGEMTADERQAMSAYLATL